MTKRRKHSEPRRYWSRADDRQLRKLYPHSQTVDVAKAIGRSLSATYGRAGTLGLAKNAAYLASPAAHRLDGVKGLGTRFVKGQPAWNKGKRGYMGANRTSFKKGNRSKRWDPEIYAIGALRINADGYLDIKVKEGLRAWERMSRWVWTTERGPIPPLGVIRAINGDEDDCRIENLRLTTRGDLMRENSYHKYPKEITRLIQLRGALNRQINKREKALEQHDSRLA